MNGNSCCAPRPADGTIKFFKYLKLEPNDAHNADKRENVTRNEPSKVTPKTPHGTDRSRRALPTREELMAHPWLRPVARRLLEPALWRMQHEAVARGVAIGIFWAFVIPVAQVVVAVVHCTWWRANIPVALAMTLVTNPLTIGFWLWLAYQLGGLILGEPLAQATQQSAGALAWLAEFGWPTVLGMGIFAVGGAALGYLGVKLIWRLRVNLKRRARQ